MITVKIEAGTLLETLRKNRDTHRAEIEEQQDGYRKAYIAAMEKALKSAKSGGGMDTMPTRKLTVPQSYEHEYAVAIEMVAQIEPKETVELSEEDFKRLWLDEWGWRPQHTMNGIAYVGDHGDYPAAR